MSPFDLDDDAGVMQSSKEGWSRNNNRPSQRTLLLAFDWQPK